MSPLPGAWVGRLGSLGGALECWFLPSPQPPGSWPLLVGLSSETCKTTDPSVSRGLPGGMSLLVQYTGSSQAHTCVVSCYLFLSVVFSTWVPFCTPTLQVISVLVGPLLSVCAREIERKAFCETPSREGAGLAGIRQLQSLLGLGLPSCPVSSFLPALKTLPEQPDKQHRPHHSTEALLSLSSAGISTMQGLARRRPGTSSFLLHGHPWSVLF